MHKPKLIRITTVPQSLRGLLRGQLRYMSEQGYEVIGISSAGEALKDVNKNEGVRVESVKMTRTISPLKDIIAAWKLYRLLKKEKPFIVHTHTPKAGTVGMLAAKLAGVPHRVHTIAGLPLLEAKGNKRRLLDVVEKATYACATRIYPNSKGLYHIIIENDYAKESKLKVIGQGSSNGIDTSHFHPEHYSIEEKQKLRRDHNLQEKNFVFVFVGRIVKDKGINELIEAFMRLDGEKRLSKLLLVGDFEQELDPLSPETLLEIENNPNIISVGYQSDVRPYFAMADCLVFPSYREGFPNVVMQAGAMGLPSIVSDINGCNEIIVEGENGIIIPAKNFNAIYNAMNRIIDDGAMVNKLKMNARNMIVDRYEQQVVWEAILAEYKSLETA